MSRNTPLPLTHPRTIANLTKCAKCDQHPPQCRGECNCKASGDPIIACAKFDFCEHPAGPRFGTDSRPLVWPSRGLGDKFAKVMEVLGLEWPAKRAIEMATRGKCKCKDRQKKLNAAVF